MKDTDLQYYIEYRNKTSNAQCYNLWQTNINYSFIAEEKL